MDQPVATGLAAREHSLHLAEDENREANSRYRLCNDALDFTIPRHGADGNRGEINSLNPLIVAVAKIEIVVRNSNTVVNLRSINSEPCEPMQKRMGLSLPRRMILG